MLLAVPCNASSAKPDDGTLSVSVSWSFPLCCFRKKERWSQGVDRGWCSSTSLSAVNNQEERQSQAHARRRMTTGKEEAREQVRWRRSHQNGRSMKGVEEEEDNTRRQTAGRRGGRRRRRRKKQWGARSRGRGRFAPGGGCRCHWRRPQCRWEPRRCAEQPAWTAPHMSLVPKPNPYMKGNTWMVFGSHFQSQNEIFLQKRHPWTENVIPTLETSSLKEKNKVQAFQRS